jgi:hypothetical protein
MNPQPVTVPDAPSASESAPQKANVQTFGTSFAYADGIIITASKPVRFTPSDTSFGHEAGNVALKVTLTIENKSGAQVNPTLAGMSLTYGDAGATAEILSDAANKVGGSFAQVILPSSRATITSGYSVPAGTKRIQGQFTLGDFTHDPAIFTGTP